MRHTLSPGILADQPQIYDQMFDLYYGLSTLSHGEQRAAMLSWRRALKVCVLCVCECVLWQKLLSGTKWILTEGIFSKGMSTVCAHGPQVAT